MGKKFNLYRHWLDSSGREHKVKAKQGTIATLNKWAERAGLKFKRDRSLFGGYYLGPSGEWYSADIAQATMVKKEVRPFKVGDTITHYSGNYDAVIKKLYKNGNAELSVVRAPGYKNWARDIKQHGPFPIKGNQIAKYFKLKKKAGR